MVSVFCFNNFGTRCGQFPSTRTNLAGRCFFRCFFSDHTLQCAIPPLAITFFCRSTASDDHVIYKSSHFFQEYSTHLPGTTFVDHFIMTHKSADFSEGGGGGGFPYKNDGDACQGLTWRFKLLIFNNLLANFLSYINIF